MIITIPGVPVSQGRMRYRKIKNFVMTYDPNAADKKAIRAILKSQHNGESFEYPKISFAFLMPILKSTRKKDLIEYQSGRVRHDKKPDIDNCIKLILDCLDGIFFHGDQKVSLGACMKLYHPEPKTIIFINETSRLLTYLDLDLSFPAVPEFSKYLSSEKDYPYDLNAP